jgi:hypothetical protein
MSWAESGEREAVGLRAQSLELRAGSGEWAGAWWLVWLLALGSRLLAPRQLSVMEPISLTRRRVKVPVVVRGSLWTPVMTSV